MIVAGWDDILFRSNFLFGAIRERGLGLEYCSIAPGYAQVFMCGFAYLPNKLDEVFLEILAPVG